MEKCDTDLVAVGALVWPLVRMDAHVLHQVRLLAEALVAVGAVEGPFVRVRPLVLRQRRLLLEATPADLQAATTPTGRARQEETQQQQQQQQQQQRRPKPNPNERRTERKKKNKQTKRDGGASYTAPADASGLVIIFLVFSLLTDYIVVDRAFVSVFFLSLSLFFL